MTEEEKKAIEVIKKRTERLMEELKIEKEDFTDEPKIAYLMQEIEANKRVLNLIQKQDTEINKLNNKNNELIKDKVYLQTDNTKAWAKYWNAMKCIDKLNNVIDRMAGDLYLKDEFAEFGNAPEEIKEYFMKEDK